MNRFIYSAITSTLLIVVILISLRNCEINREHQEFVQKATIKFEENNAKLIDAERRIYKGDVIIQEDSKLIQSLYDSIYYIKKIKNSSRIVTETKIEQVFIPFEVPTIIEVDDKKYLQVPQNFSTKTDWYSVSGIILNTGVQLDSLNYKNDLFLVTGIEDHGTWLKNIIRKNEVVVQVRDANPHSQITTLHQTIIKPRKRRFTVVVGGGYNVNTGLGVGIYGGYKLISF